MKIESKSFRVKQGDNVKLKRWPTLVEPVYPSKKMYRKLLEEQVDELSALQYLLYASDRHALLLIFQAMDEIGRAHV